MTGWILDLDGITLDHLGDNYQEARRTLDPIMVSIQKATLEGFEAPKLHQDLAILAGWLPTLGESAAQALAKKEQAWAQGFVSARANEESVTSAERMADCSPAYLRAAYLASLLENYHGDVKETLLAVKKMLDAKSKEVVL